MDEAAEAAEAAPGRGPRTGTAVPVLLSAVLVDAVGSGLYMSVSVIFFTRYLHLGGGQVGIGLSVAGALSFLALVPTGILADRVGPRRMLVAAHLVRAALLLCYPFAADFAVFLLVVSLLAVADRGASPLVQGLFGTAVAKELRVRAMGRARSMQNLGLALGGLAAGAALVPDSDVAYVAVVYANALSFLLAAVLVTGLRGAEGPPGGTGRADHAGHADHSDRAGRTGRVTGTPPSTGRPLPWARRLGVFRDRRFALLTGLNSLVSLHVTVLTAGVPLWVLAHDRLPRAVIAWTLVLNTVVVVLLQVRTTRGVESAADGGRALRRSGVLLAACCAVLALTGAVPGPAAVALVLGAVAFQAFAEMYQQAGAWAISYDLAPEDRRQVYLAFFGLGNAARNTYGPLVVTFLVVRQGAAGWLSLGAVVLVAGAWAARSCSRPSPHEPSRATPRGTPQAPLEETSQALPQETPPLPVKPVSHLPGGTRGTHGTSGTRGARRPPGSREPHDRRPGPRS
ncbi:MFS transporter [Streptomyces sp. NPDC059786]|uniref:MFS transporter n=1 Tax=Streptomyces sp. NPDC059786 TaxID=3346946 RepID=UPI0036468F1A